MAGIYIHIPFCKTKCHYCNFFSLASQKHIPDFTDILIKEIVIQKKYLGDEVIHTVYFGGGTPSLLGISDLNRIFDTILRNFTLSKDTEITLEANPDDVNKDWISNIRTTPINRISLGVQSFFDEHLKYLNRIHSASDAERAIGSLQHGGLDNMTIDLIYGIPGLDSAQWERTLERFFRFKLPHLSAYALTVEEKTALHTLIRKDKIEGPDEAAAIDQFRMLMEMTQENQYIHYEISNFALEGRYSRHNSIYWTGGHYLGVGPSAHSYNGRSRRWNKSSMKDWLKLEDHYNESFEEEVLTTEERYNEYVMTSLRTIWGCDVAIVRQEFGEEYVGKLLGGADRYIQDSSLIFKGSRLFLTSKGKLFADGIASDLFA